TTNGTPSRHGRSPLSLRAKSGIFVLSSPHVKETCLTQKRSAVGAAQPGRHGVIGDRTLGSGLGRREEDVMKPVLAVVTLLIFGVPVHGGVPDGEVPASIVGRWRSASFELELVSDLHKSVYGPNAKSVRVTDVVIRPTGDGTF